MKFSVNWNDRIQVIPSLVWTRGIRIIHSKMSSHYKLVVMMCPCYMLVVMTYCRVIKEMDQLLRQQHLLQRRTWEQARLKLRQWKLAKPKVGHWCLEQCLVIIYPKEGVYLKGMLHISYYIIVFCSYIGL